MKLSAAEFPRFAGKAPCEFEAADVASISLARGGGSVVCLAFLPLNSSLLLGMAWADGSPAIGTKYPELFHGDPHLPSFFIVQHILCLVFEREIPTLSVLACLIVSLPNNP